MMNKEIRKTMSKVNALELHEKIRNLRVFPKYQVMEAMYLAFICLGGKRGNK